jgi:glutathione S-transferase
VPHTLFVIHGSHPCVAVERAFGMKGVPFRRVELPPVVHVLIQRALFPRRTVPGLRLADGTRVQGSREIMRWLEGTVPQPPLFPAEPEARAAVEAAEAWGEETYQPIPRRLLWTAFADTPLAMPSFQAGGRIPPFPAPVVRALAPVVTRIEQRMHDARPARVRADLDALPAHFDRIDALVADGVLGSEQPNAADLQIASTTRLLLTLEDLAPMLAGRPAREHALKLFPHSPGHVPAGALAAV